MKESLHFRLEDYQQKRKDILKIHVELLELIKDYESIVTLRARSGIQVNKLKNQVSSMKRNVDGLIKLLPEYEAQNIEEPQEERIAIPKPPKVEETSVIEKEIDELRKQIENL